MLNGVSTSGTSLLIVQIGSTTVTTTGYASRGGLINLTPALNSSTATAGFYVGYFGANTDAVSGAAVLVNITGNTWVNSGVSYTSGGANLMFSGAPLALGGVLDRVRLTTVNGTDTFDAGTVNILYE
jgi:hypothetical protein